MKILPTEFDGHAIRRVYDEQTEIWYFPVIEGVQVLTLQADYQAARNYWEVLKNRLSKEDSQLVTNCNQLKCPPTMAKQRLTDVATAETLQFVPSPKALGRQLRAVLWRT